MLLRGHVIPNSHLDREWTLEFQQTRRLTVAFLDAVLDMLETIPEYTFLLDSQTCPLEDYLEIRPENESRLRRAIQAGRMSIGPWYSAPDPHTLSGESLVRNLLVGHRTAARFGPPMKVGYTPFGFGQVSQLPQIYAGFGIDMLFFYRTLSEHDAPRSEFLWEAPDGTVALCSRFGSKPRYNFFMDVWRPVAYGRTASERMYAWPSGGVPFKRANAAREWDHYFLLQPKKEFHKELLEPSFRKLLETERKHFSTHIIPLMQGMDTSMPDPMEAEIVRELQACLQPGEEVFFSTLEAYAHDVRRHVDLRGLKRFRGEMRYPGPPTPWTTTLENIGSSRPRQKAAHSRAETHLSRVAEPFSALVWSLGLAAYPKTWLDLAWKQLLLCHPHDTVGGTGIDKLERDSLYRLDQVQAISDVLTDDAMGALQVQIDTRFAGPENIILTVYNPTPRPRTEIVEVFLDIPRNSPLVEFEIVDPQGNRADFQAVHRKPGEKTVRDNCDLTMALVCWTTKTLLRAENVPPMGYRTYVVRPAPAPGIGRMERIAQSPHAMQNEFLRVTVNPDGTLDIEEKKTGRVWRGLHALVDQGERGNNWEARPAHLDEVISSRGQEVQIALVENTALSATVRVRYRMRIPAGLTADDLFEYTRRSPEEKELIVDSHFTLRKGARRLDVRTRLDNPAHNHRLRVLFPTQLSDAKTSAAETPFDVVERVIDRGPGHPYSQTANPSYPCLRFADVSDGKAGLAILMKGLHEYEVTDDPTRTLAVTLLRSYEVTLCTVSWRWERRPDQEGSQAQGMHDFEYAIYPHDADWEAGAVMRETDDFFLPLIPAQAGATAGGAPASRSLLELAPDTLVLAALKRAEERNTLVARIFNPATRKARAATMRLDAPIQSARWLTMNEEDPQTPTSPLAIRDKTITFDIGPRKVLTLEVTLKPK